MTFDINDKVFKLDNNKLELIFNHFHKKNNLNTNILIKTICNTTDEFCTYCKDIDFTKFIAGSNTFKVYSQNGNNNSGDRLFNFKLENDIEDLKNIIETHYKEKDLEAQTEDERIIQQNLKCIKKLEEENRTIKERKRKYFGTNIIVKDFLDTTKTELLTLIKNEQI